MTEEMREPTSNPESVEAVSDLAAKEVDAEEQSDVKGGAKANIAGTHNKTADALVSNIRG